MRVYYKKLHPDAQAPSKGTVGSVGWDLRAVESTVLSDRSPNLVKTGLAIACPPAIWLKLFDRSSMAMRGITVSAGVIDSDYRGEVGVVLNTANLVSIKAGDKVAQAIFMADIGWVLEHDAPPDEFIGATEWVEATDDQWASLCQTERGEGGFGSTGR